MSCIWGILKMNYTPSLVIFPLYLTLDAIFLVFKLLKKVALHICCWTGLLCEQSVLDLFWCFKIVSKPLKDWYILSIDYVFYSLISVSYVWTCLVQLCCGQLYISHVLVIDLVILVLFHWDVGFIYFRCWSALLQCLLIGTPLIFY